MKTVGLIALDLDGTLLDSRKCLSERNRKALTECARRGIHIVPTTGRAADGIVPEVRSLPGVRYVITTNGGIVADLKTGQSLKRCTLTNEKTLRILRTVEKYHAMYDPYIDGRGKTESKFFDHMEEYGLDSIIQAMVRATRDVVPDIIRYVEECGRDVEKVNVFVADLKDREPLRKELSAIPGLIISSSLYNNLEINEEGATKGAALLWLADYLGVDRNAVMAFGDGDNDISMLKAAGIGIAMANGGEAAKAAADQITLTNDEDGVADAIERLVLQ